MADRHYWLDGCSCTQPHSGLWGLLAFYLCLSFYLCWTAAAAINLTLVYWVCWLFIFVKDNGTLAAHVPFASAFEQADISYSIWHSKIQSPPTTFSQSCIYQVYHADLSGSLGKLNLSLNRTAWALGLAWMTAACVNGYGGPVDWVIFTVVCRTLRR